MSANFYPFQLFSKLILPMRVTSLSYFLCRSLPLFHTAFHTCRVQARNSEAWPLSALPRRLPQQALTTSLPHLGQASALEKTSAFSSQPLLISVLCTLLHTCPLVRGSAWSHKACTPFQLKALTFWTIHFIFFFFLKFFTLLFKCSSFLIASQVLPCIIT